MIIFADMEDEAKSTAAGFLSRTWHLYADGFKSMTVGKKLWAIIIIKLIVIFVVLKLFFFPDILSTRYSTDAERADAVRTNLSGE